MPDESDDNGNENEAFVDVARVFNCDGNDDCTQSSDLTPRHEGTFWIHTKARDRQGRETDEVVTEVWVHDD